VKAQKLKPCSRNRRSKRCSSRLAIRSRRPTTEIEERSSSGRSSLQRSITQSTKSRAIGKRMPIAVVLRQ
jgi:hypothetical protein